VGEEEDSDAGEPTPSTGELLALVDITIGEPRHVVAHSEVWRLGQHVLVVADVVTECKLWLPHVKDGVLFAPYAGPFVAMSQKADLQKIVMVQPDKYIAGHILDRYEDIFGAEAIRKQ